MKVPVKKTTVLLPKMGINLEKWAVVACDQHTSKPSYWKELEAFVGKSKSSLNLIFPECYLNCDDDKRIASISESMKAYDETRIFNEYDGFILVERTLSSGKVRSGIVMAVDLEQYSFIKEDEALIRASEGTVLERIPPRVKIREKCSLELPHIMLLSDDPENAVLNAAKKCAGEILYDFNLNMGGGKIKGSLIENVRPVVKELKKLMKVSAQKYNNPMLFAVGDGNHSLATAKKVYENEKAAGAKNPLSRYALIEVVNIYDDGLDFEPIHRVVFDADKAKFFEGLKNADASFTEEYECFNGEEKVFINLPEKPVEAVAFIESYISAFIKEYGGKVDYIHGRDEVRRLSKEHNAIGIALKSMPKSDLFPYVAQSGALPKKTFSMGEAEDKRYYLEARRIKK